MKWPTLKCPFCSGLLRNTDLHRGEPIVCPSCDAKLQHSTSQMYVSALIALCIVVAVLYFLGVRGIGLTVGTVVLWFPAYVVWEFIYSRIVPTRFETHLPKHYRGLFGG
jgi:uncharacterized paraquat-inducible protein A